MLIALYILALFVAVFVVVVGVYFLLPKYKKQQIKKFFNVEL
jgi:uncharacterized membrane protein